MRVASRSFAEGDWISIDGTSGEVFAGELATIVPDLKDPYLLKLLSWADTERRLQIWANADYPADAERARDYGGQGIGLCRTEHMFFETERMPVVQRMILAKDNPEVVGESLEALLLHQREDFYALFKALDGLPVIVRLIDPPLHEFLPGHLEVAMQVERLEESGADPAALAERRQVLTAIERLQESNPMLGLRGVRLGIHLPALVRMQVRAIVEAACACARAGDPATFIINALAPAEISSIMVNEEKHSMDIVVDDDNLAQAIGRGGQNVRLASELTGWTLNIMTVEESKAKHEKESSQLFQLFMNKLDVDEEIAEILVQEGFSTLEEVAYVPINEMFDISLDEDTVTEIRNRARNVLLTDAIAKEEKVEHDAEGLLALEGMDINIVRELAAKGVNTQSDLADLAADDLVEMTGIDVERANRLIMKAREPWFD